MTTLTTSPPLDHSYASTRVIEFWWTVNNCPSCPTGVIPELPGEPPPPPDVPRVSACLNRLNADELSRPGPPPEVTREPVLEGVRPRPPDAEGSSSEWETVQPEEEPVKTIGWQSCPAAMICDSEVNVKER